MLRFLVLACWGAVFILPNPSEGVSCFMCFSVLTDCALDNKCPDLSDKDKFCHVLDKDSKVEAKPCGEASKEYDRWGEILEKNKLKSKYEEWVKGSFEKVDEHLHNNIKKVTNDNGICITMGIHNPEKAKSKLQFIEYPPVVMRTCAAKGWKVFETINTMEVTTCHYITQEGATLEICACSGDKCNNENIGGASELISSVKLIFASVFGLFLIRKGIF